MQDDLTDVLDTLRVRRAEHVSQIADHQAALGLIDQAIASLSQLAGGSVQTQPSAPSKSVLQYVLDLANEAPKTWSADEIVAEYERRGTPIKVMDPRNAMFSALSRGSKKGDLVRVGHGRYIAARFADAPNFDREAPSQPEPVTEPHHGYDPEEDAEPF